MSDNTPDDDRTVMTPEEMEDAGSLAAALIRGGEGVVRHEKDGSSVTHFPPCDESCEEWL